MCHHELWPTAVGHPFSFLNSSWGLTGGKHYQKITIAIFRFVLENFTIAGYFPYILSIAVFIHPAVLDGFFPYLAQMITGMKGCVAYNNLWPGPISSRSFGLGLENRVHSVALQFLMDSFHIWYKWSLAWGVLHVMTFYLDLYLQGNFWVQFSVASSTPPSIFRPIMDYIRMWHKYYPMRGQCVIYQFQVNRSKSHGSLWVFAVGAGRYHSRSAIYNL